MVTNQNMLIRETTAHIDIGALLSNLGVIRRCSQSAILAVVKANAYGHGLAHVAPALADAGVEMFGVALIEEGLSLRAMGIHTPVLVMSTSFANGEQIMIEHDLTPLIGTFEQLEHFEQLGKNHQKQVTAHIDLDTGVHRQGFLPATWPELIHRIARLQFVKIDGLMTHYANADDVPSPYNDKQRERMNAFISAYSARFPLPRFLHAENTAAILSHRDPHFNLVRPGLALYGYSSILDSSISQELKPVLEWSTSITVVRSLPAGEPVSYNGLFVTSRPSRIATLCVGYADGYLRNFSNQAYVSIHGKRAPIVGRVCMDLCLCDVTDIPEAQAGSTVFLIGKSQNKNGDTHSITANDLAAWGNTISHDVLTAISSRVLRIKQP